MNFSVSLPVDSIAPNSCVPVYAVLTPQDKAELLSAIREIVREELVAAKKELAREAVKDIAQATRLQSARRQI